MREAEQNDKVQAILRMDAKSYAAIRTAARRSNQSFNAFAVEALVRASAWQPDTVRRSDLKPDPILESLAVESFGFTEQELAENPRIAEILSK